MFLGALAHSPLRIALLDRLIDEPTIMPATIVETLSGSALVVGAVALLTRRRWCGTAAVVGHVVAMAGFLLGIFAPSGDAANTALNHFYHRIMLAALVGGLLLLVRSRPRSWIVPRPVT